jgi:hypothetical protein
MVTCIVETLVNRFITVNKIKFEKFHPPMPSVRVFVYTLNRMNDIGIETIQKMVIETPQKKRFFSFPFFYYI